jgi:hypothetical protein
MPDVRSGLDPKDYRLINPNPDPDFSPERNKALVEETIREADAYHKSYALVLGESWEEKKDVLSSYARYTIGRGGAQNLKNYVGKREYEILVGEKVLSKLRIAQTTTRLSGNNRLKKGILL